MTTTIVGVFDNTVDLDRGLTRLTEEGFEDVISDDGIVFEGESSSGATAFVPHLGQAVTWRTEEPDRKPKKPGRSAIVHAFKEHLAHHHLSDDIIEGYAVTFNHDGKFALVKSNAQRADTAVKIMKECGASRVNRHD